MTPVDTLHPMGFTVIPLQRLTLSMESPMTFGSEFRLTKTPEWLKRDPMIQRLGFSDSQAVVDSQWCLIAEYDANAIGEPDRRWTGPETRSVQYDKSEGGAMANLAIWLAQPCAVCYTSVLHGLRQEVPGMPRSVPMLQQIETHTSLYCHPHDLDRVPNVDQLRRAGEIFDLLRAVSRGNALWSGLRSTWAGLLMPHRDIRYSLLWVGIEALLGPDNSGSEITYKLSQRIAFLISSSSVEAKENFRTARECYQTRSQIVHGRWNNDPKMDNRMAETERLARACLLRALSTSELRQTFSSKDRDRFLEDLVFAARQW